MWQRLADRDRANSETHKITLRSLDTEKAQARLVYRRSITMFFPPSGHSWLSLASCWEEKRRRSADHNRRHRRNIRPRLLAPWLEVLEERITPDTYNWIGGSGGDWKSAGNWLDLDVIP